MKEKLFIKKDGDVACGEYCDKSSGIGICNCTRYMTIYCGDPDLENTLDINPLTVSTSVNEQVILGVKYDSWNPIVKTLADDLHKGNVNITFFSKYLWQNHEDNLLLTQRTFGNIISWLKNIKNANVKFLDDIYKYKTFLISMSKEMKENCLIIKDFLFKNVYNNKKLKEKRSNVEKITHSLFIYFLDNFDKLPIDWTNQVKHENKHRIICDYISGMTDRYAIKLYKSIYE